MTDIFEEVEEAHRKDKLDETWRKYGWIVWLAGAAIILAVALNEYLGWQRSQARAANAAEIEAALAALGDADYDTAEAGLSAIVATGSDLAPLAAHYLAQVRLSGRGDRSGAADALVAAGTDGDDPLIDLARLKAAYLQSDTASLAELETLLAPLLGGDTALTALAQELIAAKAFEDGDFERARRDFNFLRFAPNAPPGLAQRAEIALSAIPRVPGPSDDSADEVTSSRLATSPPGGDALPTEESDAEGEPENSDAAGEATDAGDTDDLGGE